MKALEAVFPDITSEEAPPPSVGRLNYPRPISEPPSPSSTRAHSPISSLGDHDQVEDGGENIVENCDWKWKGVNIFWEDNNIRKFGFVRNKKETKLLPLFNPLDQFWEDILNFIAMIICSHPLPQSIYTKWPRERQHPFYLTMTILCRTRTVMTAMTNWNSCRISHSSWGNR